MVLAISTLDFSDLRAYVWFGFAGAAVAMVLVHVVAALGRDGATPMKIAIAGAAVTAAVTSWTQAVLLTDGPTIEAFRLWSVGTVGGRDTDVLLVGLPFLVVGHGARPGVRSRSLNALALGDDLARGLGRRLVVDRVVIGVAIVLLAGAATALAGPIAFVGPDRAARRPRARRVRTTACVLPLSMGFGAALVLLADVVGRVVLPPGEVQVGIMTAVVGAPFFLLLIRRGRMGAL